MEQNKKKLVASFAFTLLAAGLASTGVAAQDTQNKQGGSTGSGSSSSSSQNRSGTGTSTGTGTVGGASASGTSSYSPSDRW